MQDAEQLFGNQPMFNLEACLMTDRSRRFLPNSYNIVFQDKNEENTLNIG